MKKGILTLRQLMRQALYRYADRTAIEEPGRLVSYRELDQQSEWLARFLRDAGVAKGDRVGLLLDNCAEYAVADIAILKLTAVKVPLNKMLSKEDVSYITEHADVSMLIADTALQERLPQNPAIPVIWVGDIQVRPDSERAMAWQAVLDRGENSHDLESQDDDPYAPGLIIYTGGTTGKPKGVLHKQAALGINILDSIVSLEIQPGCKMLQVTPLPHSAGFQLQACLAQGGTVCLRKVFVPEDILQVVQDRGINTLFMVPTMIYRLLDLPDFDQYQLDSLTTIIYGAAPIDPARLKQGLEQFGSIFLQLYGQTECPNIATILGKEDHLKPEYQRSCGQATLTTEIRVVSETTGEVVPTGEVGEVQLRSPYTLSEYYLAPDKTAESFDNDWLRTGDLGYQLDSGHLFLVDRAKDMIISGGMNIYSSEVEFTVSQHPQVKEVAVVGVPHEDWGEAVHAVIVKAGEEMPSLEEIKAFCKGKLSDYKIPKSLSGVDNLPLTAVGKIDKKALRKSYWGGSDRAIN